MTERDRTITANKFIALKDERIKKEIGERLDAPARSYLFTWIRNACTIRYLLLIVLFTDQELRGADGRCKGSIGVLIP